MCAIYIDDEFKIFCARAKSRFTGKQLFIGLDVHKKSWSVTILVDGTEHRTFTQPPDPESLNIYLQRMFPGGEYNSAYEAGFCGYAIHRRLNELGINNIVINAADIPLLRDRVRSVILQDFFNF